MEILTMKELAPYLPYGLKIRDKAYPSTFELSVMNITIPLKENEYYKPILRPLSDIDTDLAKSHEYPDEGHLERSLLSGHASYHVFQELLSDHFDVFGLIEKGLAIDINTI